MEDRFKIELNESDAKLLDTLLEDAYQEGETVPEELMEGLKTFFKWKTVHPQHLSYGTVGRFKITEAYLSEINDQHACLHDYAPVRFTPTYQVGEYVEAIFLYPNYEGLDEDERTPSAEDWSCVVSVPGAVLAVKNFEVPRSTPLHPVKKHLIKKKAASRSVNKNSILIPTPSSDLE